VLDLEVIFVCHKDLAVDVSTLILEVFFLNVCSKKFLIHWESRELLFFRGDDFVRFNREDNGDC
jgi:hypothetical protein